MPDIDAGPHATPDQVRAAEKRAAAARAAVAADEVKDSEARTAAPKGRRSPSADATTA